MGEFDCVLRTSYDGGGYIAGFCVTCPETPAITAVAEQVLTDGQPGWNSSAVSYEHWPGDCYVEFNSPSVVGVVCGLINERIGNDPHSITHGFYLYQNAGRELWTVLEIGASKTTPVARSVDTDVYRIERRGSVVTYLINDIEVYESTLPSAGELMVMACMYMAGDGVN